MYNIKDSDGKLKELREKYEGCKDDLKKTR